jgi:hypothetical protein
MDSKPGRPKGIPKTGGRKPGSVNKKTKEFSEELDSLGFSIAENAVTLFKTAESEQTKLKVLELLASYKLAKPVQSIPKEDEASEEQTEEIKNTSSEDLIKLIKN